MIGNKRAVARPSKRERERERERESFTQLRTFGCPTKNIKRQKTDHPHL